MKFLVNLLLPYGDIAQMVERLNGIQEVAGSTPTISTTNPLILSADFAYSVFFVEAKNFPATT